MLIQNVRLINQRLRLLIRGGHCLLLRVGLRLLHGNLRFQSVFVLPPQCDGGQNHADGRSRELVVDNMTAYIDFNEVLLSLFFDADEDLDDETLLNPYDDVLVMNGATTLTDEDGQTHALTFDNCTQSFFCFYPSSGTITLLSEEAEEGFEAVIDLGEGECDSLITITIDGETREIDLEEWLNRSGIQF